MDVDEVHSRHRQPDKCLAPSNWADLDIFQLQSVWSSVPVNHNCFYSSFFAPGGLSSRREFRSNMHKSSK
jgi:hypothetical protein